MFFLCDRTRPGNFLRFGQGDARPVSICIHPSRALFFEGIDVRIGSFQSIIHAVVIGVGKKVTLEEIIFVPRFSRTDEGL